MTTPPPPHEPQGQEPWPAQQPPPGQPPTPPPGYPPPGQHGPPPGQYPGWPPAGPPKKPNGLTWALAGVALIAVIAVAVAITAVVLRSDSNSDSGSEPGGGKAASSSTSDIASANDTGPVGIVTAEPTCGQFSSINNALADRQKETGWINRDPSIPAGEWSAEQRTQHEEIGIALRNAADQYEALAKQTPHRVVRELYEQYIVYARAYADSIPNYMPRDDQLARTSIGASGAIVGLCDAITYGSAGARSILAGAGQSPSQTAPVGDPAKPARFLTNPDSICSDWITATEQNDANLSDWRAIDASIPATQWTPEQKAVNEAAADALLSNANKAEELSRRSTNPIVQDFLTMAAQYKHVYAKAIPTYIAADGYLLNAGNMAGATVYQGCMAVDG